MEIGANYLTAICGISNENLLNNSLAYLNGWLKALKNNKKLIFHAASETQKTVNFITGNKEENYE